MTTPTDATPAARLRHWLLLHDQDLADAAVEAVETDDRLRGGAEGGVKRSQFRALLNTTRMCTTEGMLSRFLRSRAERREKAGKDKADAAAFWKGVSSHLRALNGSYVRDALGACEGATASGEAGLDEEAVRMAVWRTYVQHLVAHAQLLSVRHEDRSGSRY